MTSPDASVRVVDDPTASPTAAERSTDQPTPMIDKGGPGAAPSPVSNRRRPSERFRREERREFRYLLSVALAVTCSWLMAILPVRVRDRIADRSGDLYYRLFRTYRENVIANVGQVLGPEASPDEVRATARRICRLSARNFIDLLRLPHIGRDEFVRSVRLVRGDWSYLEDALARGRGVVLMTAHLGAFDYVGQTLSMRGYRLTSVTGRTTSRFIFDAVTYLRRSHGAPIVEATPSGVRRVIQALRRGDSAAFLADYDFFQNGRPVVFFGRPTTLPPGPIRLARDTGAVVIGAFARRTPDGYALSLEEPFAVEKTSDLDADLERGMARAVTILERAIAATPDQWVMFQRVWPSAPADPVRVFPVGSPLESELLERVGAALPARRGSRPASDESPPAPPRPEPTPKDRTDPPPRSPAP